MCNLEHLKLDVYVAEYLSFSLLKTGPSPSQNRTLVSFRCSSAFQKGSHSRRISLLIYFLWKPASSLSSKSYGSCRGDAAIATSEGSSSSAAASQMTKKTKGFLDLYWMYKCARDRSLNPQRIWSEGPWRFVRTKVRTWVGVVFGSTAAAAAAEVLVWLHPWLWMHLRRFRSRHYLLKGGNGILLLPNHVQRLSMAFIPCVYVQFSYTFRALTPLVQMRITMTYYVHVGSRATSKTTLSLTLSLKIRNRCSAIQLIQLIQ